ncbi:MAG: glycosyltransferase family 39 protein [Chloroflexi bacterium]|nr:glycosyltransferase family 39 protein [Chloroflexota bacterium]
MDTKTTWQPNWAARLTIADALFALVALAAGVLRLVNLGSLPLSPKEAEAALAVWRFWQPGHTAVFPGSPAYFTLTALATQVLGFSDAVMRLVPALFGVALVLLPWLLRQRMGPVGALITAVFLAVSPITTITARTAGGEAIALFAIFLLLAAWVRWQDSRDGRWAITLAAALGLGIASAPLFYSGLAALGIAWFWQTTIGPRLNQPDETGEVDETAAETETEKETAVGPAAALTGLIVFLMLTTTFLFNLSGIGGGTAVFTAWVQQFGRSDLEPVIKPFLAIARYDLTLIIVGFAAFVWASWNRQALPRLFVYWLLGVFAIMLLQQGIISNAALASLAGYLLLGSFAAAMIGDRIHLRGWGLNHGLADRVGADVCEYQPLFAHQRV